MNNASQDTDLFKDLLCVSKPMTLSEVNSIKAKLDKKAEVSRKTLRLLKGLFIPLILIVAYVVSLDDKGILTLTCFVANVLAAIFAVLVFDVFVQGFVKEDFYLLNLDQKAKIESWKDESQEVASYLEKVNKSGRKLISVDFDVIEGFYLNSLKTNSLSLQ